MFYALSFKDSKGKTHSMKEFEGKVILIVNTATKCGLAGQFEALEKLHKVYSEKGLIVLGFPCDQFNHQEPESNETMAETCKINFGVTFLLSERIQVNGPDTHPVFAYLKKKKGGLFGSSIKWNFTKFLIDTKGTVVKRYAPTVSPTSLTADIEKLLHV